MDKIFINRGVLFFGILIFVFCSNFLYGQMYVQGNVQYSFYDHHKPLELENVKPNFTLGLGIMIFANQTSKFEVAGELNSFSRNFYQKFDDHNFKYTFPGVEVRLLTNYSLSEKWYLHAGCITATYVSQISKDGKESLDLGEGFNKTDYGAFIGCHYFLTKSLIIGSRFDFWFVRMLEYDLIGDYGDLQPDIKDIRTNTTEVFLRFQFLNQWK